MSNISLISFLIVCLPFCSSLSASAAYKSAFESFVYRRDSTAALKLYNTIPHSPYLWQRGLVAYCSGDYSSAVSQFRLDKDVNGNDGEESLWEFASACRLNPTQPPPVASLPVDSRDPRKVIRDSISLYRDYLAKDSPSDRELVLSTFLSSFTSSKDIFYADMYAALLLESTSLSLASHSYYDSALSTTYAKASLQSFRSGSPKGDFMVAVVDVLAQPK